MLVLSRKQGERILIGDSITVDVVKIGPTAVRIGIDAPSEISIRRAELGPLSDLQQAEQLEQAAAAAGMVTAGGLSDAA